MINKLEKQYLHELIESYIAPLREEIKELRKELAGTQALDISNVSGELPLTKEHICFERGHAYFIVTSIDNGGSVYGHYKCSRCGHEDNYQYDYN